MKASPIDPLDLSESPFTAGSQSRQAHMWGYLGSPEVRMAYSCKESLIFRWQCVLFGEKYALHLNCQTVRESVRTKLHKIKQKFQNNADQIKS